LKRCWAQRLEVKHFSVRGLRCDLFDLTDVIPTTGGDVGVVWRLMKARGCKASSTKARGEGRAGGMAPLPRPMKKARQLVA